MFNTKFSLIIPVYDEALCLENLIKEITQALQQFNYYEVIFIDDGSRDNSLNILKKNLFNSNFRILENNKNLGQSYSIYKGIKEAMYGVIITIDADGQNNPFDIPKMLNIYVENKDCKLVAGIRKNRKDNIIKKITSKIANFVRSLILKDGCKDTGCSLKVFDKEKFLNFEYFNGIHRFIPSLFKGFHYKVIYIDVDHRSRKMGSSKYGTSNRLFKGLRDLYKVWKILKNKNNKKL